MHLLITLMLAAGPAEPVSWSLAEAMDELDCVRDWMELCSMRRNAWPYLRVSNDKVVVVTDMDEEFEFAATTKGKTIKVTAKLGEQVIEATLTPEKNQLVWRGADPYRLSPNPKYKDQKFPDLTMRFVKTGEIDKKIAPLVKKYVPGGVCEGLGSTEFDEKAPCINKEAKPQRK
ncbi:MAG: hypothetical protein QM817_00715 [Archangium sp.]